MNPSQRKLQTLRLIACLIPAITGSPFTAFQRKSKVYKNCPLCLTEGEPKERSPELKARKKAAHAKTVAMRAKRGRRGY